jgi:GNAT superfamily N-acetyltransferase
MAIPATNRSHLEILTRKRAAGRLVAYIEPELRPVPARDAARAKHVLVEALTEAPTIRWCFLANDAAFDRRLRAYVEVGHRWHIAQGHPVHGAYLGEDLVGVAYLAEPEPAVEIDFEPFELDLLRECGEETMRRFGHYNRAVAAVWPAGRLFSLALLGIRPGLQGHGIGSRLLDWAGRTCDADEHAAGVIVDAAAEGAARFYADRGYREIAEVAVNPELRQSVLFRPRRQLQS